MSKLTAELAVITREQPGESRRLLAALDAGGIHQAPHHAFRDDLGDGL